MKLNGSEILMECLKEQGVDTIFGFPGGAVLPIYDALYKYRGEIKHYLTSHEQGAAHAADGYARATGKVGVCLATSGPGATNLVTGIATAYMDSVPIVAITGNVKQPLLGRDSFQEVDIAGVAMPITKHSFIVKDVEKIAETVRRAFYIAQDGRPGPVLVDITKDATENYCEYVKETNIIKPTGKNASRIREEDIKKAAGMIKESEKPLVFAGGGVIISGADKELAEFAEKIDAPVCLSAMGMGAIPATHKYNTGMIGMHGTKTSNMAATECDLLIAIGARFSDRVVSKVSRFAPNAKILHIDIDPAEINKNVVASASVAGDAKEVLKRLLPELPQMTHKKWIDTVMGWKEKYPLKYNAANGKLAPQYILERISEIAGDDAIITTDVGQHQMWACHYIKHMRPRHFITSGGLGTMGYGLGAAIGAKVGRPDKTVVNIAGDGCFRMNSNELATAVEYDIPIVEVIFNNHALGMVRQWQTLFYDNRYSQTTLTGRATDFIKLAEAYGALAINVVKPEQFDPAFKQALGSGRPAVINCEIGIDEKIFPMVPQGAGIDEVMLE